jgi:hypothetical protein
MRISISAIQQRIRHLASNTSRARLVIAASVRARESLVVFVAGG